MASLRSIRNEGAMAAAMADGATTAGATLATLVVASGVPGTGGTGGGEPSRHHRVAPVRLVLPSIDRLTGPR